MPDISGDFTVFARFAGSRGYFGSFAETSFTAVDAAKKTTINKPNKNHSISYPFFTLKFGETYCCMGSD
jgi:hypothetical protein